MKLLQTLLILLISIHTYADDQTIDIEQKCESLNAGPAEGSSTILPETYKCAHTYIVAGCRTRGYKSYQVLSKLYLGSKPVYRHLYDEYRNYVTSQFLHWRTLVSVTARCHKERATFWQGISERRINIY